MSLQCSLFVLVEVSDSPVRSSFFFLFLKLIQKENVNGVAVLDGTKLVGHISASDLKLIGKDANFLSTLFLPAFYFLKLAGNPMKRAYRIKNAKAGKEKCAENGRYIFLSF